MLCTAEYTVTFRRHHCRACGKVIKTLLFLCFGTNQFYPHSPGLLHWHWGNHTIAPVPVKQPWRIWVNIWNESTRSDVITQTESCAYSVEYHGQYDAVVTQSNVKNKMEHSKAMINPLRAKFFRGNIKHIFTFYVIPPHWYDTGGWNPSSNKTRTYLFYIGSIMAAGVLATQGARTSAAMILT